MNAKVLRFPTHDTFSTRYGRTVCELAKTALNRASDLQSNLPLPARADPHAALYAALTAAGMLNAASVQLRKIAEKYAAETGLQMPRR